MGIYAAEGVERLMDPKLYEPEAGDFIFFRWTSGNRHTGLVVYYDGKTYVYSIEGNTSPNYDVLWYKRQEKDDSQILAYGANGSGSPGTALSEKQKEYLEIRS